MGVIRSILFNGLMSIVYAAVLGLLIWIIVLIVLKKINKYTIRTFWFWALSLMLIPTSILALSLIISAGKIRTKVVAQAKEYTINLVSTINNTPHNLVNSASSMAHQKVSDIEGLSESNLGTIALAYAGSAADKTIDNAAEFIDDLIPDNIIVSIINKFPSLEYFLTSNNISYETDTDLVDCIFGNVDKCISGFQWKISSYYLICLAIFFGFCLLVGLLKYLRKRRRAAPRA